MVYALSLCHTENCLEFVKSKMPTMKFERLLDFFSGLSFAGKPTRNMVDKMQVSVDFVNSLALHLCFSALLFSSLLFLCSSLSLHHTNISLLCAFYFDLPFLNTFISFLDDLQPTENFQQAYAQASMLYCRKQFGQGILQD